MEPAAKLDAARWKEPGGPAPDEKALEPAVSEPEDASAGGIGPRLNPEQPQQITDAFRPWA